MALDRLHSLEMKVYIVSASTESNRILSQKIYDKIDFSYLINNLSRQSRTIKSVFYNHLFVCQPLTE